MLEIEKALHFNELYDYYYKLLTDKQREYFELYYQENLSLHEISENKNVSRNAIHRQLKNVEKLLEDYEEKLELHKKGIILYEIYDLLKEESKSNIIKKLNEIL